MGTFIAQCFVLLCIVKCYGRAQWLAAPPRQKPLPTVIITREHLLREQQQKLPAPSLYGAHGQTAAEFIVSAGLGPSKQSTAVRVRKLPNTPIKSNASNEISRHAYHGPNRRQDGRIEFRNPNYGSDIPRYVPPIFVPRYQPGSNQGQPQRNNPSAYKPEFNNRYDRDHPVRYGVNPVRKPELHTNRYDQPQSPSFRPTNYKPDYNVRRGDHLNPVAHSPDLTIRVPEQNKQPIRKPDSTTRIEFSNRRHYNGEIPGHYVVKPNQDNRKAIITSLNEYKPIISPPTRRVNVVSTEVSTKPDVSTDEAKFDDRKFVEATSSPVEILPKESKERSKDVVAETPVLKLNSGKADKIPNIIRRPSLVLRDQIIVNELPEASARGRYGPRSLERRKRETEEIPLSNEKGNVSTAYNDSNEQESSSSRRMDDENDDSSEIKTIKRYTGYWNPQRKSSMNVSAEATVKISSFRPVFDEYEDEPSSIEEKVQHKPTQIPKNILKNYQKPQRNNSPEDNNKKKLKYTPRTARNHPIRQLYDNHRSSNATNTTTPSVMSFSEFLASPVAEKIRLERQSHFRDSNSSEDTANSTARYSYHGNPLWKPSMLRELLASRLLHGMLSKNSSSSRRTPSTPDEAEQRHYGVVVSPYEGLGSNVMPVIKVLRGRIVPLPELPQELIPLLLDHYRPSASSHDEEGAALDRAILSLLQSDEFAEKDRDLRYKFNRKSPSTNHVGSLKVNEGYNRYYKPADWSLGPRCDRLTEEICLDDSDYPSSAILSSIQKDQARFELMYAEAKRASSVDVPPREHSVCPSEVHLARPHRARNKAGQWKVVVNVDRYTQTIRMEKCLDQGNPCPFVSPRVQPTCTQLYAHHRMLVFSKERGLHIDLFRVPTACACRIQPPADAASNHYYNVMRPTGDEFGGHVETAPSPHSRIPEGSASKKNLSSTLWSILGGGPKGGALAQQPQFLDEVQKQVAWTNRLPNISPSQVLKQLLDEDEEYGSRRQRPRPKPIPSNTVGHSLATPIAIPRPPSHLMNGIHRRPVVSERLFGMPAVKVSLTKDGPPAAVLQEVKAYKVSGGGPSPFRPHHHHQDQEVKAYKVTTAFHRSPQSNDNIRSDDDVEIKAYEISSNPAPLVDDGDEVHGLEDDYRPQRTDTNIEEAVVEEDYKVRPGMFHSPDGDRQWNDGGPSQFEGNSKGGPIMKPLPMGADEEDLLAVEKSEGKNPIKVEETTTEDNPEEAYDEEDDTRINFSYHPILEYLNF